MNILPYQVPPYHYLHFKPQENQVNTNQANIKKRTHKLENLNQDNSINQDKFDHDFMNHD